MGPLTDPGIVALLSQLGGGQQGQQGPQGQSMPTQQPPGATIPQTPQNTPLQQDDFSKALNEAMDKLQPLLAPSDTDIKNSRIINYTPEKRYKDLLDQYLGKHTNTVTAPGPQLPGGPNVTQTETTTNKKELAGNVLGEFLRGVTQGKGYEPLQDRLHARALKEYTAEATPLVRESLYESANKRALARDITENLKTIQKEYGQRRTADIQQQKVDIYRQTAQSQAMEHTQKAIQLIQQGKLDEARTEQAAAEAMMREVQTANLAATKGLTGENLDIDRRAQAIKGKNPNISDNDAWRQASQEVLREKAMLRPAQSPQIIGDQPFTFDRRTGTFSPAPVTGGPQTPQLPQNPQAPQGQPGGQGTIATPQITPQGRNFIPPSERYGKNFLPLPGWQGLKNIPPGATPQTDVNLAMPFMKIDQTTRNQATKALNLYQAGKEFNTILDTIPDKDFGTVMGNVNKLVQGKIASTDPSLLALKSKAQAIAFAHLGSQQSRSAISAENIANEINSWGSSKAAIKGALSGYMGQSADYLRAHPETKQMAATALKDYNALKELYESSAVEDQNKNAAPKAKRVSAADLIGK